MLKIPFIHPVS